MLHYYHWSWKAVFMDPSVPLHGRTQLGDVFNEDVSELKFLKSKPTCFVLFGKPVINLNRLIIKIILDCAFNLIFCIQRFEDN